jgi:AcrR family transcriptional regulator
MPDPGSSRLPAEKRRAQLLDTAAKVFAARGYNGATTAELAKAAGITEPIIYRHFKGKKEMFIALVERTGQQTIRDWEDSLRDFTDPAARISRLISANPMVAMRGRTPYRVIVQAMMEVEDADIREALAEHVSKLHAFLAHEVQKAQDSGQISKRFSPEITGWALMHLGLGYGILNALRIPSHGIDKSGGHIVDVIGMLMLAERYKRATE